MWRASQQEKIDREQGAAPEKVVLSLIREKLEPLRQDIDDLMRKMRLVERTLLLTTEGLEPVSNEDDNEKTRISDTREERRGPSPASLLSITDPAGNISASGAAHSLVILGKNGSSARRRVTPIKDDGWEVTTPGPKQEEDTRPAGMIARDLRWMHCNLLWS